MHQHVLKGLGIYIHIPFCIKKCNYCDFLSAGASQEEKESYGRILLEEIRTAIPWLSQYEIESIYIGGGTPSLFPPEWYKELGEIFDLAWGSLWKEKEVTMEANPGTLTLESLKGYKKAGINRLSMGLQSTIDSELKILGRIHTYSDFKNNYENARLAGFSNINVDLMSGIPGQSISSYKKSLDRVIDLAPEHISSYSLIIEEGTPFYSLYGQKHGADNPNIMGTMEERRRTVEIPELVGEEEERLMYHETKRILGEAGYLRYEISNYARLGFEAVHNSRYWKRKEYAGFGLGASSFLKGYRFHNHRDMEGYKSLVLSRIKLEGKLNNINKFYGNALMEDFIKSGCETEKIDEKAAMEEFMFLGLRMAEGISRQEFYDLFKKDIDSIYKKAIQKYSSMGLLGQEDSRIFLTDRGIDVSNQVMCGFLLD